MQVFEGKLPPWPSYLFPFGAGHSVVHVHIWAFWFWSPMWEQRLCTTKQGMWWIKSLYWIKDWIDRFLIEIGQPTSKEHGFLFWPFKMNLATWLHGLSYLDTCVSKPSWLITQPRPKGFIGPSPPGCDFPYLPFDLVSWGQPVSAWCLP